MEFELGLKLTKCLDEFESADLFISKDGAGPLFISRETETMFILTAHLRGYRREQIKIDINEDGNRIAICGERPVQETTMAGWQVYKKDVEMRAFRKAFKIPDGVVLDEIKARFNQDESILTITMKKVTKGIKGVTVEEVKEEKMVKENSEPLQVEADKESSVKQASAQVAEEIGARKETPVIEEKEKIAEPLGTSSSTVQGNVASESEFDEAALAESEDVKKLLDKSTQADASKRPKKLLCTPVIAGSSLLVSLIVFVIHLIRTKDKQEKKKL